MHAEAGRVVDGLPGSASALAPPVPGPDYLLQLAAGLSAERAALIKREAEQHTWPLAARVAAGTALAPLDIVTIEHRSRDRVNVVLRGKDLHDGFSAGEPITLGPVGKPDTGLAGRVEGIDDSTIELRVDVPPEGRGPWALVKRLDLRVFDDLAAVLKAAGDAGSKVSDKNRPLQALLLGSERPYKADPYPHAAFATLNPNQRIAAELALGATEVGLLHGPPGTGKTRTLAAILVALVDLGERPWALAESNAAVDQLALRAAGLGLDVVRMGVSARIGSAALHLTLEHRILNGARAGVLTSLRRDRSRASGDALRELENAIREEWQAAKREILTNAHVLAMTLGSLRTRASDLTAPRTALIDEASQAWEPAIWQVALRCKRIILAGDPNQLGPVAISQHQALERSLLARVVDEGYPFPMLTEQYRMCHLIQEAVSPMYHGNLTGKDVPLLEIAAPPWTDVACRFVDTSGMGHDETREASGSLSNPGEAELVLRAVNALLSAGLDKSRVAVITPYAGQLALLRSRLPGVRCGTVNAFQGDEADVIVASFVRSNPDGELGFVSDPRRLNVTISRARQQFIGIGDAGTLGLNRSFEAFLAYCSACGGYMSGWELGD